jgi:hypothetical protein
VVCVEGNGNLNGVAGDAGRMSKAGLDSEPGAKYTGSALWWAPCAFSMGMQYSTRG